MPQRHILARLSQDACHIPSFQRTPHGLHGPSAKFSVRIIHVETGGASRDRTGDPLLAKQVLSQLSYGPMPCMRTDPKQALVGGGSGRTRTTDLALIRGAL